MSLKIPFNRSALVGRELELIEAAVEAGHLSGDGQFTLRCAALLESALGAPKVLLTPSCTAALEMAALLLRLEPSDEVIVPAFAFVTTASPFALFGARPVFADVLPGTLNLDMEHVARLINPRTRAVVALHYGGVACDMEALEALSQQHGFEIIEDNAHGLFGRYRGRDLGTFGAVATQSFHETKNFNCGEGGALVINRSDWVERAEILRDKGTNRARFFRGEVDKYTWVDLGSSYLPSELQAAFLLAQLERRELVQQRRTRIWQSYRDELSDWAAREGIAIPEVPEGCEHTSHLFFLVLRSLEERSRFIRHLAERGILSVFHYQPLHLSEMGRRYGGEHGDCPVAERAGDCLVRLPLFYSLTDGDLARVVAAVLTFPSSSR